MLQSTTFHAVAVFAAVAIDVSMVAVAFNVVLPVAY
jgi:hypothetical protein